MTRPETRGFQKPIDSGKRKDVGLAVIKYEQDDLLTAARCSCGWVRWHKREKVLEDRVDKHLNEKHGGRGIRL